MKNKSFLAKCVAVLIVVLLLGSIAGFILLKSSFGVYKEIDFMKDGSDLFAKRMLWLYISSDIRRHEKDEKNVSKLALDDVKAYLVDLNDDGVNEIVGFTYSPFCRGTAGHALFILEKHGNYYENIAYLVNFEPLRKFYILNSKTDGYKKIKLHGSTAYNFKPLIIEYDKNHYKNDEHLKRIEEYLKNYSGYDVSEITGIKENFSKNK